MYAIVQIRLTKSAAQAAEEAAKKTLVESQRGFQKYAVANARLFFSEAKIHIENEEWRKASVRVNDVADQVAQITKFDTEWRLHELELREWAATFGRLANGELKRFASKKWNVLAVQLQAKIERCHGPFQIRPGE